MDMCKILGLVYLGSLRVSLAIGLAAGCLLLSTLSAQTFNDEVRVTPRVRNELGNASDLNGCARNEE